MPEPQPGARPQPRPGRPQRQPQPHREAFVSGGAYALLFLFGAAQALIGCFQYSRGVGSVPLAALGFCALILVTCLLGGAAMGSPGGALAPAIGWFAASLVLTVPTAQGSVIVTGTAAGEWYLYGGSVCAGAGVVITLLRRLRAAPAAPLAVRASSNGRSPQDASS